MNASARPTENSKGTSAPGRRWNNDHLRIGIAESHAKVRHRSLGNIARHRQATPRPRGREAEKADGRRIGERDRDKGVTPSRMVRRISESVLITSGLPFRLRPLFD
jgi:hypothetical protein